MIKLKKHPVDILVSQCAKIKSFSEKPNFLLKRYYKLK